MFKCAFKLSHVTYLGILISFLAPQIGRADITGIGVARNTGTASAAAGGDHLRIYFTTPGAGNGFDSIHITNLKLFTYTTGSYSNSIYAELYDSDGSTKLGNSSNLVYDFKNQSNSFDINNENFGGIQLGLNKQYFIYINQLDPSIPAKYKAFDGELTTPTSYGTPGASFTNVGVVNEELAIPNLAFELEASIATAVPEPSTILFYTLSLLAFAIYLCIKKLKTMQPYQHNA